MTALAQDIRYALLSGVGVLLTAVVLAACVFPARRAMRIAPTSVMRAD